MEQNHRGHMPQQPIRPVQPPQPNRQAQIAEPIRLVQLPPFARPAPVPQPAHPARMAEPVLPVMPTYYDLGSETIDYLYVPLPEKGIAFVEWTTEQYAWWIKQVVGGEKGDAMVRIIVEDGHEGVLLEEFLRRPQEMQGIYNLKRAQVKKIQIYAAPIVNTRKQEVYNNKMARYNQQMEAYNRQNGI